MSAVQGNRDYMTHEDIYGFRRGLFQTGGWPRDEDEWWHSDIKNIAYPYNYKAFNQIVVDGGLE